MNDVVTVRRFIEKPILHTELSIPQVSLTCLPAPDVLLSRILTFVPNGPKVAVPPFLAIFLS